MPLTREDFRKRFPDATDEHITDMLNLHHAEIKESRKAARAELQPEIDRLKGIEADHESAKKSQMTAEEQLEEARKEAESAAKQYQLKVSRLAAERELAANGFSEDDYKGWLSPLVVESEKDTVAHVKTFIEAVKVREGAKETSVRAELLKGTPRPGMEQIAQQQPGNQENKPPNERVQDKMAVFAAQQVKG